MAQDTVKYRQIYPRDTMGRPHVTVGYNDDAMNVRAGDSAKPIVLIGSAEDGVPNKMYTLASLAEVKQVFRSGDIVDAANIIWSPGNVGGQVGGTIYAMRVEDATRSVLDAPGLHFKSKLWGSHANNIQLAFEQNPLSKFYKITVDYSADGYHKIYDNIGALFKMQYKGNSENATAKYSVNLDKFGKAKEFVLEITDAPDSTQTTVLNPTTTAKPSGGANKPGSSDTTDATANLATGFNFNTKTIKVKADGDVQLAWTATPANADLTSLTFTSSDKTIATVDAKGKVHPLKEGNVKITATLKGKAGDITDVADITFDNSVTDTVGAQDLSKAVDNSMVTIKQVYKLSDTENLRVYDLMKQLSYIPNLVVQILPDGNNTRIYSDTLDKATDVDITKDISSIDEAGYVWAIKADIADKLDFDDYVEVEVDYTEDLVEPFGLTPMEKGSTGNVPLSWASKLRNLTDCPAYYAVPLTSSSAIHQEVKAYVIEQCNAGLYMRAFVGGGFNEGTGNSLSRQRELNSSIMTLIGSSCYFEAYDGASLHLPGYMTAALAAGLASSLPVGEDILHKPVNIISVDQKFDNSDYELMNSNGIICIEPNRNRGKSTTFWFNSNRTTNTSANASHVDTRIGLGEVRDFTLANLTYTLNEQVLGMREEMTSPSTISSLVNGELYKMAHDASLGWIISYDESKTAVYIDNERVYISVAIIPAGTVEQVFLNVTFNPYTNSTADSATGGSTGLPNYPTNPGNTDITNSLNPNINAGYSF